MPNPSLLDGAVVESEGTVVDLGDLLRTLNRGIVRSIDRDHQIGHSYLLSVAGADDDDRVAMLEFTWNNQILPLLEEYFYSQREKLAELLPPFDANKETDPPTDPSDAVEFDLGRKSGDELVYALSELVDTEEEQ